MIDLRRVKEYLLSSTGGVKFPVGNCPDFLQFQRETFEGVRLWPRQELICKIIINQGARFNGWPVLPYTEEELKLIEEWQENARNPVGDKRYAQLVINQTEDKTPLVVLLVIGRGTGKSTMSGGIVGYCIRWLMSLGDPHRYYGLAKLKPISVQCFAAKESQAIGLFSIVKSVVANCRAMVGTFEALQQALRFGGVIEAKAYTSSASSARGSDTFVYQHEECAFCGEDTPENDKSFNKTFEAIYPAVKNRFKNCGLILLPTSAGMKVGRTWKLYQDIKAGKIPNAVLIQMAVWEVNPNFSRKDFDSEYAQDFVTAEAEHGSQFVDVKHRFLTEEEVARAVKRLKEKRWEGESRVQYWMHLDPSRKHDRYAVAIGHKEIREGRIVAVVDHVSWWESHYVDDEGNQVYPKNWSEKQRYRLVPIKPQEIFNFIEDMLEKFPIQGVSSDQFESQWIIEELNERHGTAEYPFGFIEPITRKLNWLANRLIKRLINTGAFEIYNEPEWEKEALHVMRWNKNKPIDTMPDDLWGDFDSDEEIDDPNLIYTVEAPRTGKVKTDDLWDAVVFLVWKMMTNPDLTPYDMKIESLGQRDSAKIQKEVVSRKSFLEDMPFK
jgi:hypothetical protein